MVPDKAASSESGTPVRDPSLGQEGGSMRVKGLEDTRRRDRIPMRLLFGDLPIAVGAEAPARRLFCNLSGILGADGTSALRFWSFPGVMMGRLTTLGTEGVFVRMKCDALFGLAKSRSIFLDFLLDDKKIEGSTFSESWSSNSCGTLRLRDDGCVVGRASCNISDMHWSTVCWGYSID